MQESASVTVETQTSASWMKDLLAHSIIARSATMRALHERIDMLAPTDMTVLLTGETGVGKELVAEYIHRMSPRIQHPFIKVGLAALPPELLESELFGHEKGAFTHAIHEKRGLFELANSGTIFLDDIDDFPLNLQVKLLRVLESHEIMHVGGTRSIPIDTRVICASKVDLKDLVERGLFRSDLYYRINVVPILIPPLRERKDDIPILLEHFLKRYAPDKNLSFTPQALQLMEQYAWAGNIRELKNVVQRLALFCNRRIAVGDLPAEIRDENPVHHVLKSCTRCFAEGRFSLDELLACLEYQMIKRALEQANDNKTAAARSLRMSLSTFRDRMKKHGLDGGGSPRRCE